MKLTFKESCDSWFDCLVVVHSCRPLSPVSVILSVRIAGFTADPNRDRIKAKIEQGMHDCGKVEAVRLPRTHTINQPFAVVDFGSEIAVQRALALNGTCVACISANILSIVRCDRGQQRHASQPGQRN